MGGTYEARVWDKVDEKWGITYVSRIVLIKFERWTWRGWFVCGKWANELNFDIVQVIWKFIEDRVIQ